MVRSGMIYCLYIFSRRGTCLYYREWHRPRSTLSDTPSEDRKLMFGLYFSLKQLAQKMSPNPCVILLFCGLPRDTA